MFESLDKMVKIENNELFTVDPFAYTKCFKNVDHIENHDKNAVVLPVCIKQLPFNKSTHCVVLYFSKNVNHLIILMFY